MRKLLNTFGFVIFLALTFLFSAQVHAVSLKDHLKLCQDKGLNLAELQLATTSENADPFIGVFDGVLDGRFGGVQTNAWQHTLILTEFSNGKASGYFVIGERESAKSEYLPPVCISFKQVKATMDSILIKQKTGSMSYGYKVVSVGTVLKVTFKRTGFMTTGKLTKVSIKN